MRRSHTGAEPVTVNPNIYKVFHRVSACSPASVRLRVQGHPAFETGEGPCQTKVQGRKCTRVRCRFYILRISAMSATCLQARKMAHRHPDILPSRTVRIASNCLLNLQSLRLKTLPARIELAVMRRGQLSKSIPSHCTLAAIQAVPP